MADYRKILDRIDNAIAAFIERIPASQTDMLEAIDEELRKLDLQDGKIKPTVKNIKLISNIKNKLLKVILTDSYKGQVKGFLKSFNDITALQNEYWKSVEKTFKPSSILKQIKQVAIQDTAAKLMEAGIEANVAQPVSDILTVNITQGGSYKQLQAHLKEAITTTDASPGLLDRYTKQITVDSVNQYNRNYTQIVSSDLGYEWYAYQNTLINTSRPFCIAMHEVRYFHVSQIPDLLAAKNLYYTDKKGKRTKVRLNPKTGLPDGMYPTTNVSNFLTLLGGYNCGHQGGPVSDFLVKNQAPDLYAQVIASANYKAWKGLARTNKAVEDVPPPAEEKPPPPPIEKQQVKENIKPKDIEKLNTKQDNEPTESEYDLDYLINDSHGGFGFELKNITEAEKAVAKEFDINNEDVIAIRMYGNTVYRRVNESLRNNETIKESPFEVNFAKLLDTSLAKLNPYEGDVFRGVNFDKEIIDQYKKALESGKQITEEGFMSGSNNRGNAFEGNTLLIIKSKTGRDVTKIMDAGLDAPSENEILFQSGTKLKVTDIRTEKDKYTGKKITVISAKEM